LGCSQVGKAQGFDPCIPGSSPGTLEIFYEVFMESFCFMASKRLKLGRYNNNEIRKKNLIPAVIYYNGESIPISIDKIYSEVILNNVFNGKNNFKIELDNIIFNVILKDYHKHPLKNNIIHFDFQKIINDRLISLNIKLNFIGEKSCIGVQKGGFLLKHVNFIKVKCKVNNILEKIDVDLSNLDINQSIFLIDIIKNTDAIKILNKNMPIVTILKSR
jgi:large subunit ribosomal protein L25